VNWEHVYAALTIITIVYVVRKGDGTTILAILFVAAAWIASNRVDPTNTIANVIIDMVFLFVVYRYWYTDRLSLWGFLCAITILQIIWHSIAPFLFIFSVREEVWYYLAVRNVLYVSQLPLIGWYAHGSFVVSKG